MSLLTSRVLLLNFSYEPLGTVGVARAVCLYFRGAIFVEENDGSNVLHSPSTTFPVPSVVRLRHYVHVRRNNRETTMKRARIYIRDRYRCQYCGEHKHAKELRLITSFRVRKAAKARRTTWSRPALNATSAKAIERRSRQECRC